MIKKSNRSGLILLVLILGLLGGCTPKAYTVMTYNIHAGVGMDGVLDLERIARVIRDSDADMAVLHEVDKGTRRSFKVDQADSLGTLLGMESRFGRSIDHDGGEYGNALVSKYPILNFTVHELETEYGFEDRTVFEAQILVASDTLSLLGTHLGLDTLARIDQINGILEVLPLTPKLVLGGDFNFEADSEPYKIITGKLHDSILERDLNPSNSFPADEPNRRIDYIFVGPGIETDHSPIKESNLILVASDHRPQVLKFRIK
ncbi:MAG: endonuclease/exonuclease/phosphatase family protein [Candidatus Marinimicrobia bacterium]|nr:endonuclease/exonuclease/phosphatase family protein [Candidatus Neomarinimicrobiota bacterium]MCF7851345.1 endonuclease/exonuclease/phosphatase family protein [Candidatus Neomarinimicrobiota bacterium]MCF7905061.1 endonuclease/exonuclease/phosphatase family protein [Candidatus Neomarinimicrobiota bacterium]